MIDSSFAESLLSALLSLKEKNQESSVRVSLSVRHDEFSAQVLLLPERNGRGDSVIWKGDDLKKSVADLEAQIICQALEANDGAVSATAKALGVSRTTLHNKIRRYGISATHLRKQK